MNAFDTLRRAGRNLRQSKARTLLTALAIAVGAFTIMLSLAAGQGARDYATKLVSSNVDPDALFIVKDKMILGGGSAQSGLREYDPDATSINAGATVKQVTQADIEALTKRTDLRDIRPLYQPKVTYFTIEGLKKRYASSVEVYNPDILSETTAGSLPSLGKDLAPGDIVVPASFAKTLGVSEQSLVGRTITLVSERTATPSQQEIEQIVATKGVAGLSSLQASETKEVTLKIRGLVRPSSTSFTSSSAIQLPISQARALTDFMTKDTNDYQKYLAVTAKVSNGKTPQAVKQALEKVGFYPQTAKDLQGFLFTIINTLLGIVTGFGVIALIASVFGIINTQYISVLERTSQIGLMKALGMRGRHVSRLFRYEAAWIGFLGGLLGVATAWIIGTVLNPWISEVLSLGETRILEFVWWQGGLLIAGLVIIAIVAGYFPSRKAAKLDPIEALRTE